MGAYLLASTLTIQSRVWATVLLESYSTLNMPSFTVCHIAVSFACSVARAQLKKARG